MGRRGNPYFHFQQFSVWQDRCAMKVGVDGIVLGAWANVSGARRILDIGTGTGLIALMAAQRAPEAQITAIEIDSEASQQAKENVARSPWPDRIEVHTIAFHDYLAQHQTFDVVICNPPFFAQTAQIGPRAIARHQHKLSASAVLKSIRPHLSANGRLAMIIPFDDKFETFGSDPFSNFALEQNLFLARRTDIRPTKNAFFKRSLIEWTPSKTTPTIQQLVIESSRHQYTPEYKALICQFFQKYSH